MQTYVVSSGDTLYGIASKYGVSVNDIKTANNLKNNNLSIGQILKIPTIETVALYIVKKGDSLYSIAKSYDTTVDELIKLNNLKSNSLSVGQQLKLPINGNVSDGEYVVVAGDSLYSIAKKFNISVDELKRLNNLISNNLSVGQKLKVPNSSQEEVGEYQLYAFGTGDSLAAIAEVYGLTLEDTFSAACEGFIKAIEKFDTKKENRLITLATWWIKSTIQDELYRSHAIKIPHNLLYLLKTEDSENGDELRNTSLLNACGKIASLDESFGDEEDSWCLYDIISSSIEDPERVVEQHEMQTTIEEVMKNSLSEREIFVLKNVFGFDGKEKSLSKIGEELGVSKQRVQQLKLEALTKLRHPRISCILKDFVA